MAPHPSPSTVSTAHRPPHRALHRSSPAHVDTGGALIIARSSGVPVAVFHDQTLAPTGYAAVATMPLVEDLEFRADAVAACDSGVIPSDNRVESVIDEANLEEIYATERQMMYAAVTRARDVLLISSGGEPSEFTENLRTQE